MVQTNKVDSKLNYVRKNYVVFGKPNFFNGSYSIVHPEMTESESTSKIKANFSQFIQLLTNYQKLA